MSLASGATRTAASTDAPRAHPRRDGSSIIGVMGLAYAQGIPATPSAGPLDLASRVHPCREAAPKVESPLPELSATPTPCGTWSRLIVQWPSRSTSWELKAAGMAEALLGTTRPWLLATRCSSSTPRGHARDHLESVVVVGTSPRADPEGWMAFRNHEPSHGCGARTRDRSRTVPCPATSATSATAIPVIPHIVKCGWHRKGRRQRTSSSCKDAASRDDWLALRRSIGLRRYGRGARLFDGRTAQFHANRGILLRPTRPSCRP